MKRLLILFLSLAMVSAMSVTAFAAEIGPADLDSDGKATSEATVTYSAASNDTAASDEETWTVTVPATMTVGESNATVTVSGAFAESKTIKVTAPETVTLYLDGNPNNDYAVLSVDFEDIALKGNYRETSVSANAEISVQDMSDIKFGVWSGTLTFTIEMSDTENWQAHDVLTNN